MSDLLINIRFYYWHLQIGKKITSIKWNKNEYFFQKGLKGIKKIKVYKFFNLIK